MWFVALPVLAGLNGCQDDNRASVAQANQYVHQKARPPLPIPKTPADAEKLGLPVYKGSVLSDNAADMTLEERKFSRVYALKLYAPAEVDAVAKFYQDSLRDAYRMGSPEQIVKGRNPLGDEVEVMLGAASDHKKTVVLAWLTQPK